METEKSLDMELASCDPGQQLFQVTFESWKRPTSRPSREAGVPSYSVFLFCSDPYLIR